MRNVVRRTSGSPGRVDPLDPGTRDELREQFREGVERLETFLGRELTGWRS